MTSAKASGKAPASSGRPISGPSRTKCPVSIPREFINESIEEEYSLFIRKVLDISYLITSHNLNN